MYEVRRSAASAGSDVATMVKVLDEGFWNEAPMLDPDTCKAASLYLPIGTWCKQGDLAQQEQLRSVGMLMRQNMIELSNSMQPGIIKAGWSKEITDQWTAGMREECQNGTLGFRLRLAWGRRRAGPNLTAPDLQEITIDEESRVEYPFYEVYNSLEEAAAAAEGRNRDKKNVPSLPSPQGSTE